MTKPPSSKPEKLPSTTIKLVLGLSVLFLALTLRYQCNDLSIRNDNNDNRQHQQQKQQQPSPSSFHLRSETRDYDEEQQEEGSQNTNHDVLVTVISDNTTTIATAIATTTTTMTTTMTATKQIIANNANNKSPRPRLFTCGFELWNFGRQLFDDLEYLGRFGETPADVRPRAGDVLLQGGLNGPCRKSPETEFPGKILFVHSEARMITTTTDTTTGGGNGDPADFEKYLQNERFFQLGPSVTPSGRALPTVTFGAIYFASTTTKEQRRWLVGGGGASASRRPNKADGPHPRDAIVYLANRCGTFRREAAVEIASSVDGLTVHQNPKCRQFNDRFKPIPKQDWKPRSSYQDNWKLYGKYKYCLVMENTAAPNYITEKLFMAFMGGCLPVYWGSKDVFRIFNQNAFVFYDKDRPDHAIAQMQQLQTNETAYQEIMSQPILALDQNSAEAYLSLTKDVGDGRLRARIRTMLGIVDA